MKVKGCRIFPHDLDILEHCTPYYEEMDGWMEKTSHFQSFEQLPKMLRNILEGLKN